MAKYQRKSQRFDCLGICLTRAIDDIPPGKFTILKNVRSYQQGVIQPRAGQLVFNSAAAAAFIHTIRRMNDLTPPFGPLYTIIAGAGDTIYSDTSAHNSLVSRASGFSSQPLSLVPFRPMDSPNPWMYIMDVSKSGKLKTDGTFRNMGIAAPTVAPSVNYWRMFYSPFAQFNTGGANGWVAGGTAVVTNTSQTRTNTTITRIIYDAFLIDSYKTYVQPASFQEISVGCIVQLQGTPSPANDEFVLVEAVFPPAHTTTIAAIAYDSGTTGLCSVTLTATSKEGLKKDACLVLNAEMVKIIDIIEGPNNSLSIRTSTVSNHIAGETVTGIATFRTSAFNNTHAAANAITELDHRLTISAGIGTYTNVLNIDASTILNRPVTNRDFVHVGIKIDHPENLVEGKLFFDIDATTNNFMKNYFYFAFNANDFTPAVNDQITTLTARQKKLQNQLIDAQAQQDQERIARLQLKLSGTEERLKALQQSATTPPLGVGTATAARFETVAGQSQWTEFFIHLGEDHLTRVGGDTSRGLADIKAVRLQFNVSATMVVDISDFYFSGTYGAEVGPLDTPYVYAYRYRASETGARSAWSPPSRTGVVPRRQLIVVTPTVSADAQVDKIDIARFGGTLNQWTLIGTQPNSGSFNDELPDTSIYGFQLANLVEGYQPFPVIVSPVTATVNVVGVTVTRTSGGTFNINWIPGIDIIINGQLYTLYRVISTTVLELVENAGTLTGVSFLVPAPEQAAVTVASMWGPFTQQGAIGAVMFACGDPNNTGTLYWTNPDNPDMSADRNSVDVTSPSEPLVNGFVYDSRAWVFSTEELYQIYPTTDPTGRLTFRTSPTGLGLGLAGRNFFCTDEGKIIFGTRDGIYITQGQTPISITDQDLYPLFPHDGQVGITTNNFIPPDFTNPPKLRLSSGGSEIRFEYLGTDANYHTIIYNELTKSWWPDDYGRQIVTSYWEEIGPSIGGQAVATGRWLLGGVNGKLYYNLGANDDTLAIACQVRTKSEDGGDFRSKKKMGDFLIDYDPQGVVIAAQLGFDNYTNLPAATNLPSTAGRQQVDIDINNGQWLYAKNAALDLTWSSTTSVPKLFAYEFSALIQEEDTEKRSTDADSLGYPGAKWVQGFRVRANTYGVSKQITVQADNGVNGAWQNMETFTLNSNGESIQAFSFSTPFIAHLVRIVGADSVDWSLQDYDFVFEPEPELVEDWITQQTTHNFPNYQHIGWLNITLLSTLQVNLIIIIDGTPQPSIAIPSTSGLRLKRFVRVPAVKGKTFQYSLRTNADGTGFRVYQRDLEVAVKPWASSESYNIVLPFGDISRESGARI